MTDTMTAPILTASNLTELLGALNHAGQEITRLQQAGLDAGALIGDYGRAVSECPTFGGEAPEDLHAVWSWDHTHLLIGEGWGNCKIIARAEW